MTFAAWGLGGALASVALLAGGGPAQAQAVPRSQRGSVTQHVGHVEITITYSRPVARGRELFGRVVRFGRTWTPGADRATYITLSDDITIGGEPLPAGKYSIWAIPRHDRWTIIFSHEWDVFHIPYPGEAADALRLTVLPTEGPHMETLTFHFPVVDGLRATLALHWGTTVVELPIAVE